MATIEITDQSLVIHITGMDRLLSLRSRLTIPLAHVVRVVPRPEVPEFWSMEGGAVFRGAQYPGTLCAGTVTLADGAGYVFCDVHDPRRAVAIELHHDKYKRVVVDVSDETPEVAVQRISAALAAQGAG